MPARVESACHTPGLMLSVTKRTEPSPIRTVTPPVWAERASAFGAHAAEPLGTRPTTRFQTVDEDLLALARRMEKDLPEGLALVLPIQTNPSVVDVRGPERLLEEIDSVPLLPVDLSGLRGATNVPTSVDTAALEGLRVTPTEVNVILRVVPADSQPGGETVARRRGASRIR